MADYQWELAKSEEAAVSCLKEAGYSRVLACLLANRGIRAPADAETFLSPSCASCNFHDPFRMKDMDRAAQRIRKAVASRERITIYGDYDVDGVTAASLFFLFLKEQGADAHCYIPDRESEGYGLNKNAVRQIVADGTSLIVTVDTGITALEEIRLANELGADVVVTDHHEPREQLPEACAVVNPKRRDCGYPFKGLSGVGVAFKLACALGGNPDFLFEQYGGLVCLGTVADIVPLTDENRMLVKRGLAVIGAGNNPGIRELCAVAGCSGKKLTAASVAFGLAPRVNAGGRMGSARTALKLFTCGDGAEAFRLAGALNAANARRQSIEKSILGEVLQTIDKQPQTAQAPIIVVCGEGWHNGVVGIVASRVTELFAKPSVLVSFDGDSGRASCRSVAGFDLFKALSTCSDLFEKFGGHSMAAGFSINKIHYPEFCSRILRSAASLPASPAPELRLECALSARELTLDTAYEIARLEPFGNGNPAPLFLVSGAAVKSCRLLSEGKHCKYELEKDGLVFSALLFGRDKFGWLPSPGDEADFAVSLEPNLYKGNTTLSVFIRAVRARDPLARQAELYRRFLTLGSGVLPETAGVYYPTRDEFAAVYRYYRALQTHGIRMRDCFRHLRSQQPDLTYFKLQLITDVLEEAGLITVTRGPATWSVAIHAGRRADLTRSALLQKIRTGP